jgi:hypothetical protein
MKATYRGFFDRDAVLSAVGKAGRKNLNDAGRAIRKQAQRSLRYADGPSSPGSPPHAHRTRQKKRGTSRKTGKALKPRMVSYLREFLYYKFDFTTRSVVVGPEKLSSTVDSGSMRALEEGGTSRVTSGGGGGKTRTVTIRPRPYMKPALASNIPQFRRMWANSVRP